MPVAAATEPNVAAHRLGSDSSLRRCAPGRFLLLSLLFFLPLIFYGKPGGVKGDLAQIRGNLRQQALVERFAGNHCKPIRAYVEYRRHPQVQLALIANDFFEGLAVANRFRGLALRFVKEFGKADRGKTRLTGADEEDPGTVPGSHPPPLPGAVAFAESSQRVGSRGFPFFYTRRQFIAYRRVHGLHAAQL
jgi:hypothetical protein